MSGGLVVTKQQFIDAIFKLATEEDTWKRWNLSGSPWNSGVVFEALREAGLLLVNKKALQQLKSKLEEEQKGFKRFTATHDYRDGKIVLLEELLEGAE